MILETAYLVIGFICALVFVAVVSYYDEGDNELEDYVWGAGVIGLMITVMWPLVIPVIILVAVAWYVSEHMGKP